MARPGRAIYQLAMNYDNLEGLGSRGHRSGVDYNNCEGSMNRFGLLSGGEVSTTNRGTWRWYGHWCGMVWYGWVGATFVIWE